MLFTGDIIPENPVLAAGRRGAVGSGARFEFRPLFAPVAALVGSFDLAVCHMEVPVGAPGEQPGARGRSPFGGNRLVGPFELAGALGATGFDRCSTASNHAFDIGAGGIDSTIDALESVGMSWSGTARRPEELRASVVEVRSVRIAHLSYTRSSNTARPADPWRLAFADDPAVVAQDVSVARAAGADLVVVSIHLSKELRAGPTPDDRAFVETLVSTAAVDAVIQHGPHVVQGFELVSGTPVWWSLGNFVSGMARPNPMDSYRDPRTRDGIGAVLTFTEAAVGSGHFDVATESIGLCNEAADRTVRRPTEAVGDVQLNDAIRAEMAACVERIRAAIPDAT